MKSVLLSTRPKWCERIASGKKTFEVRKTTPKCEVPFKVFIYQTKSRDTAIYKRYKVDDMRSGKVIGEFICDKVEKWEYDFDEMVFGEGGMLLGLRKSYIILTDDLRMTCLSFNELSKYGKGKTLYGWHISQLKIYDKPKELREFYTIDESGNDCCIACVYHETPIKEMPCRTCTGERRYLYRPPQSWCYVEE